MRPAESVATTSPKPGLSLASFCKAHSMVSNPAGAGFDQRRHEDVEGAETHAEPAQSAARVLVERADVLRDIAPIQEAEILDESERHAARNAGQLFGPT